jgi:hypothetical protein
MRPRIKSALLIGLSALFFGTWLAATGWYGAGRGAEARERRKHSLSIAGASASGAAALAAAWAEPSGDLARLRFKWREAKPLTWSARAFGREAVVLAISMKTEFLRWRFSNFDREAPQ